MQEELSNGSFTKKNDREPKIEKGLKIFQQTKTNFFTIFDLILLSSLNFLVYSYRIDHNQQLSPHSQPKVPEARIGRKLESKHTELVDVSLFSRVSELHSEIVSQKLILPDLRFEGDKVVYVVLLVPRDQIRRSVVYSHA